MKEERNIITMNEFGNVVMPKDIQATAMSEWELCELFNVTAPSDKCSMEVYSLETIIALAFRIGTYSAKQVRNAVLERLYLRKEKTSIFFSLNTNGIAKAEYFS